jgi:hypothetical protein
MGTMRRTSYTRLITPSCWFSGASDIEFLVARRRLVYFESTLLRLLDISYTQVLRYCPYVPRFAAIAREMTLAKRPGTS